MKMSTIRKKEYDINILYQIEDELNSIKFKNIPLGGTLSEYYRFIYLNEVYSAYFFMKVLYLTLSLFIKLFIKSLFQQGEKISLHSNILFTKIAFRKHLNSLIDPLIIYFKDRSIVFIGKKEKNRHISKVETIDLPQYSIDITNLNRREDILLIFLVYIRISIKLIKYKFKYSFKLLSILYGQYILLKQLRRVSYWTYTLKNAGIRLVVTEYDRYDFVVPIILCANYYNIKTITLVHGVINPPFGYVPVLAESILCWGEEQKKQLIDMGVPVEKIKIVGCPFIDSKLEFKKNDIKLKYGFLNNYCIVLAVNPMATQNIKTMIEILFKAVEKKDNVKGIIKLHPSQLKNTYLDYTKDKRNIVILQADEITNEEVFAMADLVCIHNSGFGNEALLKGIPVAVFNILVSNLGNGKILIDKAKCPQISNYKELSELTDRLINDPRYSSELINNSKELLHNLYFAIGDEATSNIKKVIGEYIYD
jgi:hypothetical protein